MYLLKSKFHYRVHKSLSLHAFHSRLNPDRSITVTFQTNFIYGNISHVIFNQEVFPLKRHVSQSRMLVHVANIHGLINQIMSYFVSTHYLPSVHSAKLSPCFTSRYNIRFLFRLASQ